MGKVIEINGPLVTIELADVRTGEEVHVGSMNLSGEVIGRNGARALVQVYEPTESLRPGEPVTALGHPLSVELGPGLLAHRRPDQRTAVGDVRSGFDPAAARGRQERPDLEPSRGSLRFAGRREKPVTCLPRCPRRQTGRFGSNSGL